MNPGQSITPTITLVHQLGQGGMGSVWVADHHGLSTRVAVKFLSPAFAQNESIVKRFRREAMAAAQIKSPHVAQVFDHGVSTDGTPYIVMELLDGEDLRARLRRIGPLDPREVASIVTQTAKALTRAHQLNVVHRDIKADNIFLIDVDGELFVKVLDFGVAKLKDDDLGMTSTGSMVGTPLYMSPEQLLSAKHVDYRTDLWSLGVLTYYSLTGRYPFFGETIGALSIAVHAGVFALPSAVRPGLPLGIDVWMHRALRREPAERFGSAKEMAEELWRAVMSPAAALLAGLPAHPGVPLPAEPPAGVGHGSTPSHPSAAKALSYPNDTSPKTLGGAASTSPGSQRGKGMVIGALMAALGMAATGGGIWFFFRHQAPGLSESKAEPSPAASMPAETAPVAVTPAVSSPVSPSASTSASPPAAFQAPPVPSGLAPPLQPAAASGPASASSSPPAGSGKPPPTTKKPTVSPPRDTIGF